MGINLNETEFFGSPEAYQLEKSGYTGFIGIKNPTELAKEVMKKC